MHIKETDYLRIATEQAFAPRGAARRVRENFYTPPRVLT